MENANKENFPAYYSYLRYTYIKPRFWNARTFLTNNKKPKNSAHVNFEFLEIQIDIFKRNKKFQISQISPNFFLVFIFPLSSCFEFQIDKKAMRKSSAYSRFFVFYFSINFLSRSSVSENMKTFHIKIENEESEIVPRLRILFSLFLSFNSREQIGTFLTVTNHVPDVR